MTEAVARISIDGADCDGHGRCYALAPSLFAPDEVGTGVVVKSELGTDDLPAARLAESGCPELAIRLEMLQ